MKKYLLFFSTILSGIFCGCEEEVTAPDFDVAIENIKKVRLAPAAAGQDSITAYDVSYKFLGQQPEYIVMYSGEPGSDYQYRERDTKDVRLTVQFSTNYTGGEMNNTLRVLVSTDFVPEHVVFTANIAYTKESIEAAHWTDITGSFNIPGNALTGGVSPAGEVDITSYLSAGQPLFLAFRYDVDRTGGLKCGSWTFSNFKLINYEPGDNTKSEVYSDKLNAYWLPVNLVEKDSTTWVRSAVNVTDNTTASVNGDFSKTPSTQTLLISKAFYPNRVTPDRGSVVKLISEITDAYTYRYTSPAKDAYKVVFIATNSLNGDIAQVVKEVNLSLK
jgi:hypothetical protein